MSHNLKILIIDDDKSVVVGLRSIVEQAFPEPDIIVAYDGHSAWNLVLEEKPNIVISDITIEGIDGFQLCKRIRENAGLESIFFIAITATTEKSLRIKALEQGADSFVTKPFSQDEMAATLGAAKRIVEMQLQMKEENQLLVELADELQRDINDMAMLAVRFLQARLPASADMLKRVAEASVWVAKKLGEFETEDLKDVEIAALLSYSGRIFLPDTLVKNPVLADGVPTHTMMYQVPVYAKEIVSSVRRFKDVGEILYHIYENFDGSGIPKHVKSWQIPLGARIIRVALDYEELRASTREKPRVVMERLKREAKRLYDHRVVTLLEQYHATIGADESGFSEKALMLNELNDGMVLTRDIFTNSGMKIMSAGSVLSVDIIRKIYAHNSSDPILGNIFVKM